MTFEKKKQMLKKVTSYSLLPQTTETFFAQWSLLSCIPSHFHSVYHFGATCWQEFV
jgi:hypothetical protein